MKITLRCLFTSLIMLSLAGCGLKGPLYMPDETKSEQAPTKSVDKSAQETQQPKPQSKQ